MFNKFYRRINTTTLLFENSGKINTTVYTLNFEKQNSQSILYIHLPSQIEQVVVELSEIS
jgi:hypothetical protein